MFESVQIIHEQGIAKFAVLPFDEFTQIRSLLSDKEQLEDYLDLLHVEMVKKRDTKRHSHETVLAMFEQNELEMN